MHNGGAERVVTGANLVIRTHGTNEWQNLTHETGRIFDTVHDCDSEACSIPSSPSDPERCCPLSGSICEAHGGLFHHESLQPAGYQKLLALFCREHLQQDVHQTNKQDFEVWLIAYLKSRVWSVFLRNRLDLFVCLAEVDGVGDAVPSVGNVVPA